MNHTKADRGAYQELGKVLAGEHSSRLSTQLSVFQSALINFAVENGDDIKNNPQFRHKFTQICDSIGVDPLELLLLVDAKSKKSDSFYVGIGVRIVEICQETRNINGGLISFKELHSRLQETVTVPLSVSESEVQKALDSLATLGNGYEIITINKKRWVKFLDLSGPETITNDQRRVYELCEFMGGFVTYRLLRDNYNWDMVRSRTIIDEMIMNGFLWVDTQGPGGESLFWEPSWISKPYE